MYTSSNNRKKVDVKPLKYEHFYLFYYYCYYDFFFTNKIKFIILKSFYFFVNQDIYLALNKKIATDRLAK